MSSDSATLPPELTRPLHAVEEAHTIYPLSHRLRRDLLLRLPSYRWPSYRWVGGPDPRCAVLVLWRTGMHPDVLANPKAYHVYVHDGMIEWTRTKTRARALMPLHVQIRDWAAEFFLNLTPRLGFREDRERKDGTPARSVHHGGRFYSRLVEQFGRELGIPGVLSPRTMRHTCIADLYDASHDPDLVCDLQATSDRVLREYRRMQRVGVLREDLPAVDPETIRNGTWGLFGQDPKGLEFTPQLGGGDAEEFAT